MSFGLLDRTLRNRDMARQEEEVGLLTPGSKAAEHIPKVHRGRGICGFRPRHRQVFAAMLCFLALGLIVLSILTAWVLLTSVPSEC